MERRLSLLAFIIIGGLLAAFPFTSSAQNKDVIVDYNNPKEYIIGKIRVEGNTYYEDPLIISVSGLELGQKVTIPGETLSDIVRNMWKQQYLDEVSLDIDGLSENGDSVYLCLNVREKPRLSMVNFTGVKSGEKKELLERLRLRKGSFFTEYESSVADNIIRRFYAEKGFINCKVDIELKADSTVYKANQVWFNVKRGEKIKVKDINFIGNNNVSDFKLSRAMKKTKSNKFYNFFNSKKFNEKEYLNDKKGVISAFNENGYRDARIVRDSVYYVDDKHVNIDIVFDEGDKYYFRNLTWTGNSVYPSESLDKIVAIKKGDVYDMVTMEKKLFGGGKQGDYDVTKAYRDNGYLFFSVTPVETNIQNDSVDVEFRITEGKQATFNNIIINGNDLTNEKVVRRQVFTRPGYLFTQSDFERSIREIASLGQFDAEAIADPSSGYSIIPNPMNNTVDVIYNVTEKPSSQLELSGGWGGYTFVATVGVSFNNFSTQRFFDKSAWRPVPLGDAQNLAFRFQTNGTYYTALTANFTEPWLFGKKPTSLNLSAYYTRQTNSNLMFNILSHDRQMEVFGFNASLGKRLKWPDNYFVLYNGLSWQTYKLTNWYSGYFIFDHGAANNISYTLSLSRNSTDQQIYPRSGSDFSFSLSLTPPFSLMRKTDYDAEGNKIKVKSWRDIDYNKWSAPNRYRWIEYNKWKFSFANYNKIVGDLVLMTRAQFGYLGYYNKNWGYSPFEGFLVGGDGMSGYNTYGSEVVSLRGYENYSLTPQEFSAYNSTGYAYSGNVYDKFTVELRYPVILQPSSTIFALVFLEAGNCWSDIKNFNPFHFKRSAGVGARIFLPMVGLLGVDWGYGFDDTKNGGSHFHFVIGQQF